MTLHKKRLQWVALTPTLLIAFVAGAGPSDFEITRPTIDSGGEMYSTKCDYEVALIGKMHYVEGGVYITLHAQI